MLPEKKGSPMTKDSTDNKEPEQPVSLVTINGGAAVEAFDDELRKVLDNIGDPNTKPDFTREVTLTVKISPDEQRRYADVIITAKSKVAPTRESSTLFWLGKDPKTKKVFASERNINQMSIDDIPGAGPQPVADIGERRK